MTGYDYADHLPADFTAAGLRADVRAGLLTDPKSLPPKWFYDKTGSALFEEITRLPEYYPTRAERAILERSATEVLARSGARTLVELGSGSSEKTRLLLDALMTDDASRRSSGGSPGGSSGDSTEDSSAGSAGGSSVSASAGSAVGSSGGSSGGFSAGSAGGSSGGLAGGSAVGSSGGSVCGPSRGAAYVALDVSETALRQACESVAADYPGLRVQAVRADFEHQLSTVLGAAHEDGGRMLAFLGGTIGNLAPDQRHRFLAEVRAGLGPGDSFLLGADLVKSPGVLLPAYDDAAGVTAAFNLNLLAVLNAGLGADFEVDDFEHVAHWDPVNAWIEMRLRAVRAVRVWIADLDAEVKFAVGEEVRTEISAKFTRDRLTTEFTAAGFAAAGWWTDPKALFSLSLWTPV